MQEHEKTGGNAPIPDVLKEIASACDGKINEVGILPDGSGFATMSMPLRPDHWIYGKEFNGEYEAPPMVFRMGAESRAVVDVFDHSGAKQKPSVVELEEILAHTPAGAASIRPDGSIVVGMTREEMAEKIREAGKYAVRSATMQGKEMDFDPDALLQNLVVGFLGYWTEDGLSGCDDWANPPRFRKPKTAD